MIQSFADWVSESLLHIEKNTHLFDAVSFFIYDSIKIFILLAVIIFIVTIFRTFIPPSKIKKILSAKRSFIGNILAAIFGIFTPFCTCSAIPLFMGFLQAGVPAGVTFSFLIASPMINEVAIILLLGMFGWKIALLYIISGLFIAIFAGVILGKLKVEQYLIELNDHKITELNQKMSWSMRLNYAKKYTVTILKKVWLYILVGIAIGGLFHGYVPADFLAAYAGAEKWYAVPIAVLLGVPLYSNAAGIVPLVSVLTEKGIAMGTVLAFMMATVGLSLPEFMILKRVMRTKLILIFAAIVTLGIILTGYLFNIVLR